MNTLTEEQEKQIEKAIDSYTHNRTAIPVCELSGYEKGMREVILNPEKYALTTPIGKQGEEEAILDLKWHDGAVVSAEIFGTVGAIASVSTWVKEAQSRIDELTMDNMTHEYNQAEAERTWPHFKEQIEEPLKETITSLQQQIQSLKQWKDEAIAVMPDYQKIGKLLNVKLGDSVHDKIIPGIESLQKEIQSLKDEVKLRTMQADDFCRWLDEARAQIESLQQGRRDREQLFKNMRGILEVFLTTIEEGEYFPYNQHSPLFMFAKKTLTDFSALQAGKGGWIDCTEQLPGNEEWCNDIVLYYDARNRRCKIGCYDYEFSHWNELPWSAENEESKFEDVTHWQPLPAAPEQKDNDKNQKQ